VVYGLTALAHGAAAFYALGAAWTVEQSIRAIRATGWIAIAALALSLCATPVGRVVRRIRGRGLTVARTRRALGIAAAASALVHLSIAVAAVFANTLDQVFSVPWIRAGASSFAILFALWITSYPVLVRALRVRYWKALHRLAYVALALAWLHALTSPFAARTTFLAVGTAFTLTVLPRLTRQTRRSKPRPPAKSAG
jgi:sulfoxide reductase heme-binding subunit YedZ